MTGNSASVRAWSLISLTLLTIAGSPASPGAKLAESGRIAGAQRPEPGHIDRLDAWRRAARPAARIEVLDPLLAQRLQRLRRLSPTFAEAWRDLERSGTPIAIGSHDQLRDDLPRHLRDGRGWAGLTVTWSGRGGAIDRSAVAIRVSWVRGLHASFGNPDAAFYDALDELLIHEVYGHLVPVVLADDARATCPDPAGDQRLADSCVGMRIAAVALELTRDRSLAAGSPRWLHRQVMPL